VSLPEETEELLAGLKGKHAIYLVVEGPEVKQPEQPQRGQWGQCPQQPQRPKGLFTLHGIGFGTDVKMPVVPQVTITVDGQKLNIPDTPIRFSNANGYSEQRTYQVYGPLKTGSKIEATATAPGMADKNPGVTFRISPVTEGRATVKATYNGLEKVFLIN